jgi:NAD(P)-dependent dehydrogenase (short-subunit alcohol dehydrogenase family)
VLLAAAASIRADGGDVAQMVADVTVEDDVRGAVDAAIAHAGNLRGVVANAGGGGGLAPYHAADADTYLRCLQLNLVGTMLCVKHSVGPMARGGGGSFVGMSSIAGLVTHPVFGAYPVAKAGIDHMMRNAADEYGPVNVRFNSVQPGLTPTEINSVLRDHEAVFDSYVRNTPLGGVSTPEDVARVVSFLIGPDAARITGQAIAIDGGHHLRAGPDLTPFTGVTPSSVLDLPADVPADPDQEHR